MILKGKRGAGRTDECVTLSFEDLNTKFSSIIVRTSKMASFQDPPQGATEYNIIKVLSVLFDGVTLSIKLVFEAGGSLCSNPLHV